MLLHVCTYEDLNISIHVYVYEYTKCAQHSCYIDSYIGGYGGYFDSRLLDFLKNVLFVWKFRTT